MGGHDIFTERGGDLVVVVVVTTTMAALLFLFFLLFPARRRRGGCHGRCGRCVRWHVRLPVLGFGDLLGSRPVLYSCGLSH
jgi:hypothetical protein